MKKLVLLVCIFALLIAATGAVSADKPAQEFTITGYTTSYDFKILSESGPTVFNTTAAGESNGYLKGPFTYKEWGSVDLVLDPNSPYVGTGKGVNTGLITITNKNDPDSQAIIWYGGQLDAYAAKVWGTWHVVTGKGKWDDLSGHGNYTGTGGETFTVVFTGDFD
jgi:hypothetical protein